MFVKQLVIFLVAEPVNELEWLFQPSRSATRLPREPRWRFRCSRIVTEAMNRIIIVIFDIFVHSIFLCILLVIVMAATLVDYIMDHVPKKKQEYSTCALLRSFLVHICHLPTGHYTTVFDVVTYLLIYTSLYRRKLKSARQNKRSTRTHLSQLKRLFPTLV